MPNAIARPVTQKTILRVVLAGFTLVILFLLAAGLLGVRSISSVRSTSADLLEEQVRIGDILDMVLREQRAINAIYATFAKQPEQIEEKQVLSQLEASDRDIEQITKAAEDEPEQPMWRDLYKAVTGFTSEARVQLDAPREKRRPLRELMSSHQRVLSIVDKLVEANTSRSVRLKQELEDVSARLLRESSVLLGASLLLALVCAVYTLRLARDLIRQLEWQAGELSRVSWNLLEKQETTARRFSHELHDELGQSLTAVKANLVSLAEHANGGRAQLDDCLHLVDEAIVNVRELSQLLRPTILDDFGLSASLKWLTERFHLRTGIEVDFRCTLDGRLADETETHLFRIAQEALTNVARHAGAKRVSIDLKSQDDQVTLHVTDDGKGLSAGAPGAAHGLGMVGMRARARSAGGELKVESAPERGVEIVATFPFRARKD